MKFIKEKNTYIFLVMVICFTAVDVIMWKQLSLVRKFVTVFAVLAATHEIEEKIWPGGFFELMLKKFGIKKEETDLGRATLTVSIYWLLLLALPYIFDQCAWLLVITIALSFFEAFIHTAGIAIHHMKKPYTPGLVTAWLLAIAAIIAIIQLNAHSMVSIGGYVAGTVLMILSFICMDIVVISGLGKRFSDIINNVRGQKNK